MIILVTCIEDGVTFVSHGVDESSGRNVVLQAEPLSYYTRNKLARHDPEIGEYVLVDQQDDLTEALRNF